MKQSRETRIEHYCDMLGLSKRDKKDLHSYFYYAKILHREEMNGNYSYSGYIHEKRKFDDLDYRITAVGLYQIKHRFQQYLNSEKSIFSAHQSDYPELNENEIWEKVYQTIDQIILEDIDHAKAIAKERHGNIGCLGVLILTVIASITLLTSTLSILI